MTGRRILVWTGGLFAAVTALAVSGAVLVVNLPAVVEWAAPVAFDRLGLVGDLTVRRLGWRRAVIADAWIGPGPRGQKALSARRVVLDYDLGGFPEILVHRVVLAGLEIHAQADATGLSLGALTNKGIGDQASGGFLTVKVGRLEVMDGVAAIDTPQGMATLDLSGAIDVDPRGAFSGALEVTRTSFSGLPVAVEGLTGRAEFTGQETVKGVQLDTLNAQAAADRLETRAVSVDNPILTFSVMDNEIAFTVDATLPTGPLDLTAGGPLPSNLTDPGQLEIAGRATAGLDGLSIPEVAAEILSLKQAEVSFALNQGQLDLKGGLATSAGPLTFSAAGPLLPLFPLGPSLADGWTGTVNADLSGIPLPGVGGGASVKGSVAVTVAGGAYTFTSSDTAIAVPGLAALTGLAFTATAVPGAKQPLDLRVNGATFRHLAPEPAVTPLTFSGRAALNTDGRTDFSADIRDPGGSLSVHISGRHETAAGRGRATVRTAPLTFTPAAAPGLLFPVLAGLIDDVTGEVEVKGGVAWRDGVLTSDLKLLARDVSFSAGDVRMERLNTVIAFDRPWPPSTPPGQAAAIALINAGVPLNDNLIVFQLTPDRRLRVERTAIHLAGGQVNTNDTVFDLTTDEHVFTLEVFGMDLGRLLGMVELEGLSGTGTLAGRIPVRIRGDAVEITGGYLESIAPGVLRYAPTAPSAALQGSGETGKLLLQALDNFQYKTLKASIDRQGGGDTLVGLHLKGANPDLLDGYPIEFNLNVSGMLDAILRGGLAGYRVPDAIRERMENFGG